jgi:hypothetical protein
VRSSSSSSSKRRHQSAGSSTTHRPYLRVSETHVCTA